MSQITNPSNTQLSEPVLAEEARRKWLSSLKPGDEVEVPYSQFRADILRMKVLTNDGGWLRLLTVGKRDLPENWIKACAVNGWTAPYRICLVPPGTTKAGDIDPEGPTQEQLAALQQFANENGRNWRKVLSLAWATGRDERQPNASFLRQVRNEYGTAWLFSKRNPIKMQ